MALSLLVAVVPTQVGASGGSDDPATAPSVCADGSKTLSDRFQPRFVSVEIPAGLELWAEVEGSAKGKWWWAENWGQGGYQGSFNFDVAPLDENGNYASGALWGNVRGQPNGNGPFSLGAKRVLAASTEDRVLTISARVSRHVNMVEIQWDARLWLEGGDSPCPGLETGVESGNLGASDAAGYSGDPVNTSTGNFFDPHRDLIGSFDGYGFEFTRSYNSMDVGSVFDDRALPVLGEGWTTTVDEGLFRAPGSGLEYRSADGRRIRIPSDGAGGWNPPPELLVSSIVLDDGGDGSQIGNGKSWENDEYTLTRNDGTYSRFDHLGRLMELGDGAHQRTRVVRSGATITVIAESDVGGTWQTAWQYILTDTNADGRIDLLEGPDGTKRSYSYDAGGILQSVSQPYLGAPAPIPVQETFTIEEERITEIFTEIGGGLPARRRVANLYDAKGRVLEQWLPDGDHVSFDYGPIDASTQQRVTTATFNSAPGVAPAVPTEILMWTYGADGRLLELRRDGESSGLARSWDRDLVAGWESSRGASGSAAYDTLGRLGVINHPAPQPGAPNASESVTYCDATPSDHRIRTTTDRAGVQTDYAYGPDPLTAPCGGNVNDHLPTRVVAASNASQEWQGATLVESSDGLVTRVEDPDGVVQRTHWDPVKRLLLAEETVLEHGPPERVAVRWFAYDGAGRRVVERTPEGLETWTIYDPTGAVAQEVGPVPVARTCDTSTWTCQWGDLSTPPAGPTRSYTYWADGSTKTATDEAGQVTEYQITNPASGGRVETVTGPVRGFGDASRSVTVTTYDSANRMVSRTVGEGADAATTTYGYDDGDPTLGSGTLLGHGRLAWEQSPEGVITHYRYDADGNVTRTVTGEDPNDDSRAEIREYDLNGQLTRTLGPTGDTDEQGNPARAETTYDYDVAGRLVETATVTARDAQGEPVAWSRQWYRYDPAGRQRYVVTDTDGDGVDPGGIDTPFAPDDGDHVEERRYTPAGRLDERLEPPANATAFAWTDPGNDALKRSTVRTFDDAGRPERVVPAGVDPATGGYSVTYDDDGNVLTELTPEGTLTAHDREYLPSTGGWRVTATMPSPADPDGTDVVVAVKEIDARGSVVFESEPQEPLPGHTGYRGASFDHYNDGLLRIARAANSTELTDPAHAETTYAYDSRGNRTSRTAWTQNGPADPHNQVTEHWTHDLDDNPVGYWDQMADPATDPATRTWGYDPLTGRHLTTSDASGRTTTLAYRNDGNVASRVATAGNESHAVELSYNAAGWRTSATYPDPAGGATPVTSAWSYTPTGALATHTSPGPAGPGTLTYQWDLAGNRIGFDTPGGSPLDYVLDEQNRIETVRTCLFPQGTGCAGWWDLVAYAWDDDGRPLSADFFGAGSLREWTWAANGSGVPVRYRQLLAQTGDDINFDVDLTWTAAGRLDEVDDGTATTTYTYDHAGQLTGSTGPEGTYGYTYDPRGLRLTSTLDTTSTTYQHDDAGRLVRSDTAGGPLATHAYDEAGRRSETRIIDGTEATVEGTIFGPDGRPTENWTAPLSCPPGSSDPSACTPGSPQVGLTKGYDADGHMVHASGSHFTWDTAVSVPQIVDADIGGTATHFVYGHERLVQGQSNGGSPTVSWWAHDHQGSALPADALPAPDGYDPFGTPSTPGYMGFGYRGELHLGDDLHLRNRDYDTTTGTFTTTDPLDGIAGSAVETNPYHYASNDPVNRVDPLGLRDEARGLVPPAATGITARLMRDGRIRFRPAGYGPQLAGGVAIGFFGTGAYYLVIDPALAGTLPALGTVTGALNSTGGSPPSKPAGGGGTTTSPTVIQVPAPVQPPDDSSGPGDRCTAPQTGADDCGRTEVLIDTSAVYKYKTLVPLLESRGERGVISTQVELELQNNTYKNPYPAHPFAQVPDVANSVVMGRMRQQYAGQSGPGIEGDIIIGTTAITSGRKLYTSDFGLEAAVVKSGGQAEYVP